jgi:hypothetical protein
LLKKKRELYEKGAEMIAEIRKILGAVLEE